jgi:group I intron endonuclease
MDVTGVYAIYCSANEKIYIGSSIKIRRRLSQHFVDLRKGNHVNRHLQSAFNKYGEATFICFAIAECKIDDLRITEQKLVDMFDKEHLFNTRIVDVYTNIGTKRNAESIQRMSISHKGQVLSAEHRRKIGESGLGRVTSESTRKKQSESNMGRTVSNEARRKISEANTGRYVSEEARKKRSDFMKGHAVSKESRDKMKGRIMSEENRQKLRGRLVSEETRTKIARSKYKPVAQYEINGTFIRKWESMGAASVSCNISRSNISSCCRGKTQRAGKFKWKYLSDTLINS